MALEGRERECVVWARSFSGEKTVSCLGSSLGALNPLLKPVARFESRLYAGEIIRAKVRRQAFERQQIPTRGTDRALLTSPASATAQPFAAPPESSVVKAAHAWRAAVQDDGAHRSAPVRPSVIESLLRPLWQRFRAHVS